MTMPFFFCQTISRPRTFTSTHLSLDRWRESEQTWISSVIDCLVYNNPLFFSPPPSSCHSGRRGVRRWIWISTMRLKVLYVPPLSCRALRPGEYISSSVSRRSTFPYFFPSLSLPLLSRVPWPIQRMITATFFLRCRYNLDRSLSRCISPAILLYRSRSVARSVVRSNGKLAEFRLINCRIVRREIFIRKTTECDSRPESTLRLYISPILPTWKM